MWEYIISVLLLLVTLGSCETTVNACESEAGYDDIISDVNMGNCSSCQGRCGSPSNFMKGQACSCDELCYIYNDCCPDFHKVCPSVVPSAQRVGPATCESFKTDYNYEYLVVSSCIGSRLSCRRSPDSELTYIPVYDPDEHIHYVNYNCAKCNGAKKVLPWNINVTCKANVIEEKGYGGVSGTVNGTDFTDVWGMIRQDECWATVSPTGSMEPPRPCTTKLGLQRLCHKDCPNRDLRKRCEHGHLLYVQNSHGTYANLACSLCYGPRLVHDISCDIGYIPTRVIRPSSGTGMVSLKLLFDLNTRRRCASDEIWIPQEQKCRLRRACDSENCEHNLPYVITLNALVRNVTMTQSWLDSVHLGLADTLTYSFRQFVYTALTPRDSDELSVTSGFKGDSYPAMTKEVVDVTEEFLQRTMGTHFVKTTGIYVHNISDCEAAVYEQSEFKFGFNGTIIINDNIIKPGAYYITNKTAYVCISGKTAITLSTMDVVTIVFTVISIICLLLRIICHYVFPTESDKVAVRLQLSLTVALLIAFTGFLLRVAAWNNTQGLCYVLAVLCHWGFLSAFSWMTVIAIDIVRMIRNSLLLRKVGSRKTSFIVYSLFAWGAPVVIVAMAIGINHSDTPLDWRPDYLLICWISGKGLLVYFLLPSALLFLVNIVSFVASVIWLYKTQKDSLSKQYKTKTARLVLHANMLALMGITWLFGFIAAPLDQDPMWYVFIILNGCQGVFLLLVYVMRKSVQKTFLDKTRTWTSRSSSTNSRTNSSSMK